MIHHKTSFPIKAALLFSHWMRGEESKVARASSYCMFYAGGNIPPQKTNIDWTNLFVKWSWKWKPPADHNKQTSSCSMFLETFSVQANKTWWVSGFSIHKNATQSADYCKMSSVASLYSKFKLAKAKKKKLAGWQLSSWKWPTSNLSCLKATLNWQKAGVFNGTWRPPKRLFIRHKTKDRLQEGPNECRDPLRISFLLTLFGWGLDGDDKSHSQQCKQITLQARNKLPVMYKNTVTKSLLHKSVRFESSLPPSLHLSVVNT